MATNALPPELMQQLMQMMLQGQQGKLGLGGGGFQDLGNTPEPIWPLPPVGPIGESMLDPGVMMPIEDAGQGPEVLAKKRKGIKNGTR